jgi:hypothetical protein
MSDHISDRDAVVIDIGERRRRSRARVATIEEHRRELRERDAHICLCTHRCATHGSYVAGEFVGIGFGPCGWPGCDCDRFTDSGAKSYDPIIPVPDYDREQPIEHRTCPDCHADPGEPCHWACSSWWT